MFEWIRKVNQDTKHLKEIEKPKQRIIRVNLTIKLGILRKLVGIKK